MKILVLGGNQFLGKALCKKLLELGHRVYALNRGTRENGGIRYVSGSKT